jgi:hypothetical protein
MISLSFGHQLINTLLTKKNRDKPGFFARGTSPLIQSDQRG